MNKSWLICVAILAALALAAPAARGEVMITLSLDVDTDSNMWFAYASLSDPDNETQGIHSVYFDIWGTDGLTVDYAEDALPWGSYNGLAFGFHQLREYGLPIAGGLQLVGAKQEDTHKRNLANTARNIVTGVGETAGSYGGASWDEPVLIGIGTYVGEGTLHLDSRYDAAPFVGILLLPATLPAPTTGGGAAFQAWAPPQTSIVAASLEVGGGGPTYNVLAGQPYAVFSPEPIPSDAAGGLGTTGQLIGPHTASQDTNVSMDWRVALGEEADLLIGDVVDLNGIIAGDLFALQMSYDPDVLLDRGVDEQTAAEAGVIYVARNIGTPAAPVWVNAGDTSDPGKFVLGPYGGQGLGFWGVDTLANVAWVVTNQSSEFAVVPEPGTLMLLLLGGLGLALCRRRSK